jgi:uncharacterized protein (TIGR03437 family)
LISLTAHRARRWILSAVIAQIAAASIFAASCNFTITPLQQPEWWQASYFLPIAINNAGEVVGNCGWTCVLSAGTITPYSLPGATSTTLAGINNLGDLAGVFSDGKGTHGFLESAGKVTVIDYPGGTGTVVSAVNDAGVAVGSYSDGNGTHAFKYQSGTFTALFPNDLPNSSCFDGYACEYNAAVGINNHGQILVMFGHDVVVVGATGFSTLIIAGEAYPYGVRGAGIDDAGDVVGWTNTGPYPASTGWLFTNGQMISVPVAGYTGVSPYGINSRGQIVGAASTGNSVLEFVTSCQTVAPQTLAILAGDGQDGAVQTQLPNPLVIKVTGADGLGAQGTTVNFAITSGGGTLSSSAAISGPDGAAETSLLLGKSVGPVTVRVTVAGLPPVQFKVTAVAPPAPMPGTISLSPPQISPLAIEPQVFDWNGDGIPDLISFGTSCMSLALGNGDGTFQTPTCIPLPGLSGSPCGVAFGDLNADGRADLVVSVCGGVAAGQPQGPFVFLRKADGTLNSAMNVGVNSAFEIALDDFNGDGKLDLALITATGPSNSLTENMVVLLGNGDGSFAQSAAVSIQDDGAIFTGDMNGDGKLDIVFQGERYGVLSVLLGKGDGTFQPALTTNIGRPWWIEGILVADFNGDGKLDVAAVEAATVATCPTTNTGDIVVWLGNGDGTFRSGVGSSVSWPGGPACPEPLAILTVDFDGDGKLDIATIVRPGDQIPTGPPKLVILPGKGDGTFGAPQSFQLPDAETTINGSADLNGDGKPDLVLVTYSPSESPTGVGVILNNTPPYLPSNGVVNASSYATGPVSPGEIVTVFGSFIGPPNPAGLQLTPQGTVSTNIGGVTAFFDGVPAPLISAALGSVNLIVPYSVATQTSTQLQLEYQGQKTNTISLGVAPASPGLFTLNASGKGPGAIVNSDGKVNSPLNPAQKGSLIVLFGTGAGQTNPPGVEGSVAGSTLPVPTLPVTVMLNGTTISTVYDGAAYGSVAGLLQINVLLPPNAPSGTAIPISFQVGSYSSQSGTTVAIQ